MPCGIVEYVASDHASQNYWVTKTTGTTSGRLQVALFSYCNSFSSVSECIVCCYFVSLHWSAGSSGLLFTFRQPSF